MPDRTTDTYLVPSPEASNWRGSSHRESPLCLTLCFHPEFERIGEVALLDLKRAPVQLDRNAPRFRPPGAPQPSARGLETSFVSDRYPLGIEAAAHGGVRLVPSATRGRATGRLPERDVELGSDPLEISADELGARGIVLVLNRTVVLLLHYSAEHPADANAPALLAAMQALLEQAKTLAAYADVAAASQAVASAEALLRGSRRSEATTLALVAERVSEVARWTAEANRPKSADLVRRAQQLLRGIACLDRQQHGVIGASCAVEELWEDICALPRSGPVLILGEQGSGKSEVAKAIARFSARERPLLYKNAAGLVPSVAAAELFGRKKGFLGTDDAGAAGIFRTADKGTLFLDEIAELSAEIQAKLLDAVERNRITPVGDGEVPIDVRLLTATNRDLRAGGFKPDLYDRLAGLQLRVPSLRERRDDIPRFVLHFLREYWQGQLQRAPDVREMRAQWAAAWAELFVRWLCDPWPGNVRVLRDVVRRLALANPISIDTDHLSFVEPVSYAGQEAEQIGSRASNRTWKELTAMSVVDQRAYLEQLLAEHGSQLKAAAAIHISGPTLNRQCKKLGLHVSDLDDEQLANPPKWANAKAVTERRKLRMSPRPPRSSS